MSGTESFRPRVRVPPRVGGQQDLPGDGHLRLPVDGHIVTLRGVPTEQRLRRVTTGTSVTRDLYGGRAFTGLRSVAFDLTAA